MLRDEGELYINMAHTLKKSLCRADDCMKALSFCSHCYGWVTQVDGFGGHDLMLK